MVKINTIFLFLFYCRNCWTSEKVFVPCGKCNLLFYWTHLSKTIEKWNVVESLKWLHFSKPKSFLETYVLLHMMKRWWSVIVNMNRRGYRRFSREGNGIFHQSLQI